MPKRATKGQKCPKNAPKFVKGVLKMAETAAECLGKVRTCLQKACMTVCEHVGTVSFENHGFDRLCPFLSIFACFGAFGAEYGHVTTKCPKYPFEKGTSAVKRNSWPCRLEIFPKLFHFWSPPNRVSAKNPTFLSDLAYRKFRVSCDCLYGGDNLA